MKIHFGDVQKSILDIKQDERTEVFNFGKDNAFPSLFNELGKLSVTSKTCIDKVAKAIYGGGLNVSQKFKVNSKQTLNQAWRFASRQFARQNNVYLHVTYDLNFKPKSFTVIPVTHVRKGKADDKGYSGKYLVYDNWDKVKSSKIMSESFNVIDTFNPREDIVRGQIEEAGSITEYKGQILHINKEEDSVYGYSDLYPVLNDALNEVDGSVFKRKGSKSGYLNTKVMIVPKFADEDDKKAFKKELNNFKGAENAGDVVLLEADDDVEDVKKSLQVSDLTTPFNDKIFEYSEKTAEASICKAFGIPIIMVRPSEGVFGNNGTALYEARKQVYQDREEEREQLLSAFNSVLTIMAEPVIVDVVNPYADEEEQNEVEDANKKAQANLRGSVGGVQAFIDKIVLPIANGLIDVEQGIKIVVNIYGFTEDKAREMLEGTKKQDNDGFDNNSGGVL